MTEIYKKVYLDYEISNLGNCRRLLLNGKYLKIKGSIGNRGYRYFQQNRQGKRKNFLFHHLVALAFIGPRPDNLVIDHIDRNKLNNNVKNLRYITQKENLHNCDRYRDDIKETDPKKRHNIQQNGYRESMRESKKLICTTCPLIAESRNNGIFASNRDYKIHMNSQQHKMRLERIEMLKSMGLEINKTNYKKLKNKISDSKRNKKINCECGSVISIKDKNKHYKTKKHMKFINTSK